MTTNLNSKSRRRGATAAGLGGLALASVLLLCGAGNAPIENFTPQGAMQADLNAGGHSVTNAATLSATNVVAANLMVNGKTLGVNNTLTLAGTDGSTLNVGAGGTLGSNAFSSTAYVSLSGTQTLGGIYSFTNPPILSSNTLETASGLYTINLPTGQNDTLAALGHAQTFTALQTITVGSSPTAYTGAGALFLNYVATNDSQVQLPAETISSDVTESSGGTSSYVGLVNAVFTHGSNGIYKALGYNSTVVDRSPAAVGEIDGYYTHCGNQSLEQSGTASNVLYLYHFHAAPVDLGSSSDTVTNAYGLYIEPQVAPGVTNGYGVYQTGPSDINSFAGPITITNNALTMQSAQPCLNMYSTVSGGGEMHVGYWGDNYPGIGFDGGGVYAYLSAAAHDGTEDNKLHWRSFNGSTFYDFYSLDPATGNTTQIGSATAAGFAYAPTTLTGAATLAVNTAYEWNGGSNATLTLPATCAVGNRIVLFGNGAASGLATISKASGQSIYFGSGSAYSTVAEGAAADSITLVCTVANTSWSVESSTGSFTDTP